MHDRQINEIAEGFSVGTNVLTVPGNDSAIFFFFVCSFSFLLTMVFLFSSLCSCNPVNIGSHLDIKPLSWLAKLLFVLLSLSVEPFQYWKNWKTRFLRFQ